MIAFDIFLKSLGLDVAAAAHSARPVLEVGRIGLDLVWRAVITGGPHAPFTNMLATSNAELLAANLTMGLDVALVRNYELMDYYLFIHLICLYKRDY